MWCGRLVWDREVLMRGTNRILCLPGLGGGAGKEKGTPLVDSQVSWPQQWTVHSDGDSEGAASGE